jgi:beta-ribofuranosylaminobenzene 5'-phosphate synthase
MPDHVEVQANARLHLGFLDLNGDFGRRFGSLGLAIDRPVTSLSITRAARTSVEGAEHQRVANHLAALCKHLKLDTSYEVKICQAIPAHAGLGSGTQLALTVAQALRLLEEIDADAAVDAMLLQRGARSGAGAALFRTGGLVVDGGHRLRMAEDQQSCADEAKDGRGSSIAANVKGVPPILARLAFPQEWRIILVIDMNAEGVHGADERAAFARLPEFSAVQSAEICRSVLMQVLPAVAEHDLALFGEAITRIQQILGDYFAPAQGGSRFTSARVGAIMNRLQSDGAHGIGQSSWGPTGFAFAESMAEAEKLVANVADAATVANLELVICKGANHGAVAQSITNNIR